MIENVRKNIVVLMSTYNGEKYLEEQMNSLFSQKDVNISILVRDDGSTDRTKIMLEEWSIKEKIKWYEGHNIGPAKSFLDLINKAPDSDYYAFCDQDDIWDEDKLVIAIQEMSRLKKKGPSMYHCLAGKVDENLKPIPTYPMETSNTLGFNLTTPATGCTMVFNKELLELSKRYTPRFCAMHDLWLHRICVALDGNIIYDPISHIKYRLHGSNSNGKKRNLVQKILYMLTYNDHTSSETSKELLKGYSDMMTSQNLQLISQLANYRSMFRTKIGLMFNEEFYIPNWKKNLYLKFLILTGKL